MQCIAATLDVPDVAGSIAFYVATLGFAEGLHIPGVDRRPRYATVWNGEATVTFHRFDHLPEASRPFLGTGVTLYIDLGGASVDEYYRSLTGKGVRIVKPIADEYWGARDFTIADNSGYHLTFAQQIAELTPEQMLDNLRQETTTSATTPGSAPVGLT